MSIGAIITSNRLPLLLGAEQVDTIEVRERLGQTTYYSIRFKADILDDIDIQHLNNPLLGPNAILGVLTPSLLGLECLVQGPVFGQNIHLQHGGEGSYVTVQGADRSIMMDRTSKAMTWPNARDSDVVSAILATYAFIPNVFPTAALHLELKHSLIQRGTDLQLIRKLAKRNGCHFWITCDPAGIETAHFQRLPLPSPPINLAINVPGNNIDSFDIDWDVERPSVMDGMQLDLSTKTPIPGKVIAPFTPPLAPLNLQALSLPPFQIGHLSAPVDDVADLMARNESALAEASWFIRAHCNTSVHRLNQVVRANTIVNVSGIGIKFMGPWLVAAVTHKINAQAHLMELELIKNGWNSPT